MTEIKFGTDGWRAVLNKDFNKENTNKVINAAANYIYNHSKFANKIIIGYDPRRDADFYAVYIAQSLANKGFDIELSDKIVATPVLAYTALKKNAYAIMLTASHNPPEYLGIKIIPPYGGPADDLIVKEIVSYLNNNFNINAQSKEYKKVSFEKDYVQHIKSIIDLKKIKEKNISINYDGHHGAAGYLFKEILDSENIENYSQNLERDVNFGGQMPDPKEKYLPELKALCKNTKKIGLSNDGDGDRFGVFNEKGEYVSANEIIALLLRHLVKNKKYTGKLAKTVGSSVMLNIYAQKYAIEVIETPVGFKWLGEAMRKDNIIIAGEESGGLSIKGHIPEKDGILANLLIMEMLAFENKKLYELQEELKSSLGRGFINQRIDLQLESEEKVKNIMEKFNSIEELAGYKIKSKTTLDGIKLYLGNSSILIRKSGTEPLLRIYFESDKDNEINALITAVKLMC